MDTHDNYRSGNFKLPYHLAILDNGIDKYIIQRTPSKLSEVIRNGIKFIDIHSSTLSICQDAVNLDKSWVYTRKPLIERGCIGSFDKDMLSATEEILTLGDEHWIYAILKINLIFE